MATGNDVQRLEADYVELEAKYEALKAEFERYREITEAMRDAQKAFYDAKKAGGWISPATAMSLEKKFDKFREEFYQPPDPEALF